MKLKLSVLLCTLALPKLLLAIGQHDFAYIAETETTENTPFYELEIPTVVYETITRTDLGDLRVLNGEGEVVPHGLRSAKIEQHEKVEKANIPFFPLYQQSEQPESDLSLNIQRGPSGEIININSRIPGNKDQRLSGYLLDLRKWNKPISKIIVNWKNPGKESFIRKLRISKSHNLERWQYVASGKTLINMAYQNHKLTEKAIKLQVAKTNYLQLRFEDQQPGLEVDSIQVFHTESTYKKLRNRKTVNLKKTNEEGEFTFKPGLKTLARALEVKLPDNNTVVRVKVFSRSSDEQEWLHRGSALLYRLTVNDTSIEQSTVNIYANRDSQWLIKFDQQGGGIGSGLPEVKLSWYPQTLVFVARGEAPYRVAWGSTRVKRVSVNANQLLPNLNKNGLNNENIISTAVLLSDTMRPVNKQMLQPKEKEINWQHWILWIVLVAAALMLIWMGVRLTKKMAD
jgi:hypothetical protein